MDLVSGLKTSVTIVIPTRKLNNVTVDNITNLSRYFIRQDIYHEIIVVSNNDAEEQSSTFKVYHNKIKNAAISRNIGIEKSGINKGIFIFLDDDIIIENGQIEILFNYIFKDSEREIYAPYLTGHFINQNYKFNFLVQKFYSWIANQRLLSYEDIQGKSLFSLTFPPIFYDHLNPVQWIPGGFMIFKNFDKTDINFDLSIFYKSYYMEDFYLSNMFYLNGINISMLPIKFHHKILYNKFYSNWELRFKETVATELNRYRIQKVRSKFTGELMSKFKAVLFSYYLYRLKDLKIKNFVDFFAVVYLLIWKTQK